MKQLKLEENGKVITINDLNNIVAESPILREIINTLSDKAVLIVAVVSDYLYLIDEFPANDELHEKTPGICFHVAQFKGIKGRRIPGEWVSEEEAIKAVISYHKKMMFGE